MGRINSSYSILDYINNSGDDRISDIKIKIMLNNKDIFSKKKILIYGLGKSGTSAFKFLKKKMKFIYMMTKKFITKIKKLKKN